MTPALDLAKLPAPARKVLDPASPAPMRMMAARGIVPGLKPGDLVAVLAALAEGEDPKLAEAAQATLSNLPPPLLAGALSADLEPGVIDALARLHLRRDDVIEKLIGMPRVPIDTVAFLAARGSERVTEHIATNEARLLENPVIIEKLYMNKATRMSTADRIIELAGRNNLELHGVPAYREVVAALQNELIAEPSEERTPDDLDFLEAERIAQQVEAKQLADADADAPVEELPAPLLSIHSKLANLSISGRIRRAILGTGAERNILLSDTNKLVATAAIRSPMIQEEDVERISKRRQVNDEVLRIIATNGRWLENHTIKFNLVSNPRTPFMYVIKLVAHLRDDELKRLEKSREVAAPVRTAAKQQLSRKGKGRS